MKAHEEILDKHLRYGNPTSIQDYLKGGADDWVFKEHVLAAMREAVNQAFGESKNTLTKIRQATYDRDTSDGVLKNIDNILTENGYPFEFED